MLKEKKKKKLSPKELKKKKHNEKTISEEIRHLYHNKGYPIKRAVAVAINMAKEGKLAENLSPSIASSRLCAMC
ncbi:MAG: hypothetical protein SNJ64_04185 [Endomicrobiia bacterium]